MRYNTFIVLMAGLIGYGLYNSFLRPRSQNVHGLGLNLFDPAHIVLKPKRVKRRTDMDNALLTDTLNAELSVNGLSEYPLLY